MIFIIGLIIGFVIGGVVGVVTMALCAASGMEAKNYKEKGNSD